MCEYVNHIATTYVVAKYLRLSIEDSKTDSMSIENQRLQLDGYIENMPEAADVLEFVDNGYSGTNFERPAVQELLELVRTGRVNCVIVKDFTRFGRNSLETGYFIERLFPLYRVRFISVCDAFDSADYHEDTGGIDIAFKYLIAELYSRDLSKKIQTAKRVRMVNGELIHCPFGYRRGDDGKMEFDSAAAKTVWLIFDLALEGKTMSEIRKYLCEAQSPTPAEHRQNMPAADCRCLWNESTIWTILTDEQYTGTYVAGKTEVLDVRSHKQIKKPESKWIKIPDHHPDIVSKDKFERVQAIIASRRKNYNPIRATRDYALKGKAVCGCCGHSLSRSHTTNAVFSCRFTKADPTAECFGLKISEKELEKIVFTAVSKRAREMLSADGQSAIKTDHDALISEIRERKNHLYEQFKKKEILRDEYHTERTKCELEISKLIQTRIAIATETGNISAREAAERVIGEKRLTSETVAALIDKVRVHPNGYVDIDWKGDKIK